MRERVIFRSGPLRLMGELYLPAGEGPWPGVALIHGLGSRKERHEGFGVAAAERGFVVLTFDMRGHGESEGKLDGRSLEDLASAVDYLASRPEVDEKRLAVRGGSMGGHFAIHGAATIPALRACVAICPAPEWLMMDSLKQIVNRELPLPEDYRCDLLDCLWYLRQHDLAEAVTQIAPRPILLIHDTGDELVPANVSEDLYRAAKEPKDLWLIPGGNHARAAHDPAVNERSLAWLASWLTP